MIDGIVLVLYVIWRGILVVLAFIGWLIGMIVGTLAGGLVAGFTRGMKG